jgi:hypothetical protein
MADTPMKETETTLTPGKTAEEKIKMLTKIATVVHFQVRVVLNARVLIVDRERYPDFYFDMSKLQILFANPAGVLKANLSLLLTTISMSIFIPVPKKPTKNKIFDNEVVISNRKNAVYQMLSKPLRGFINYDKNMEPFTIFEMGKLYFNLDADTHKSWKPNPNPNKPKAFLDEYLPVINLTAQTPVIQICFGSSIIEKLHSLAVGFLDKNRLVDLKQKGRGLKIGMAGTAQDLITLRDIYNKNKQTEMKLGKLRRLDRKLEEVKLEARPAKNANMNQHPNGVYEQKISNTRLRTHVKATKPEEKVIFVFKGTNRRK